MEPKGLFLTIISYTLVVLDMMQSRCQERRKANIRQTCTAYTCARLATMLILLSSVLVGEDRKRCQAPYNSPLAQNHGCAGIPEMTITLSTEHPTLQHSTQNWWETAIDVQKKCVFSSSQLFESGDIRYSWLIKEMGMIETCTYFLPREMIFAKNTQNGGLFSLPQHLASLWALP